MGLGSLIAGFGLRASGLGPGAATCGVDYRHVPHHQHHHPINALLGGSLVVIGGLMSRVTIVIAHIKGLITPLITTHEPPSRDPEQTRYP